MTITPLTITRATAAPIILAAYKAGTLAAQTSNPQCIYYNPENDSRCPIGWLFSLEYAKARAQDSNTVFHLITKGHLLVDDPDWFREVQVTHDAWALRAAHCLDRSRPGASRGLVVEHTLAIAAERLFLETVRA